MTGVPVMPMTGTRSPQLTAPLGTAVAPPGSRLVFHSGAPALVVQGLRDVASLVFFGRDRRRLEAPELGLEPDARECGDVGHGEGFEPDDLSGERNG